MDHEKAVATALKVRNLGKEYAQQTNTRTVFDGLLIKKAFN